MKSTVSLAICFLVLLVSWTSSYCEEKLIFRDTYRSKETESGTSLPEIQEEMVSSDSGIIFRRYKKDGNAEKTLQCIFEPQTGQLISAHVERSHDGEVYETVDVSVEPKQVVYSRACEKSERKTIKRKSSDLISVPDALHFSIGKLGIKKGEMKNIMMINWDGGSLMFTIKGKDDVWIDGNRYREISCQPNLPFFAQAFVQWENTYWYPVDSPYMALFRGKQGPFDKPIEIWRAQTGRVEVTQ
ncbi:MAG: hypothetical protein AB1454_02595 [Candidatus Auribacterota bacterium]